MGYAIVYGTCLCCGNGFSFNPHHVPSHPARYDEQKKRMVPSMNAEDSKEPICQRCIKIVNEGRKETGRDLWPVHEDAYEPIDESELY